MVVGAYNVHTIVSFLRVFFYSLAMGIGKNKWKKKIECVKQSIRSFRAFIPWDKM